MQINLQTIQAELQELAGKNSVKVKLDKHMDIANSIRETDMGFSIRLNPTRLRSPKKLEEHIQMCREAVSAY